jgi:hypothetical protein
MWRREAMRNDAKIEAKLRRLFARPDPANGKALKKLMEEYTRPRAGDTMETFEKRVMRIQELMPPGAQEMVERNVEAWRNETRGKKFKKWGADGPANGYGIGAQ